MSSNIDNNLNKRRAKRVKARFIVTCNVDRSIDVHVWIGRKEIDALMLDLSESGMAIQTKYDIPAGSVILIKFTLVNLYIDTEDRIRSMEITGKVLYNTLTKDREYRLGIFFINITEENKTAIADFVRMKAE